MSAYGHHHFQPGPGPAPYPGAKAFRPEPTAAGRVAFVIAWVFAGLAILFSLLVALLVFGFAGSFLVHEHASDAAFAIFGGIAGVLVAVLVAFVAVPPLIIAIVATTQASAWSKAAMGQRAAVWFFAYTTIVVLRISLAWLSSDLHSAGISGVVEGALGLGAFGTYVCAIVFMFLDASEARRQRVSPYVGPTYGA